MALLSFCHYSSDPSGKFIIEPKKNDSNLLFRCLLLLDFVLCFPCVEAHYLRATPSNSLCYLNLPKSIWLALTPT
jgi:hypothetical protein